MNDKEETIGSVNLNSDNNVWIYCIYLDSHDILMKHFADTEIQHYLSTYDKEKLRDGDIVLIYMKSRKVKEKPLFTGFCQLSGTMYKDNNISVFKDINKNRFIIKIDHVAIFKVPIPLEDLDYNLASDPYYKSERSFRIMYCIGDQKPIKIPYSVGRKMMLLFDEYLICDLKDIDIKKPKEIFKKQKKEISLEDFEKTSNSTSEILSEEKPVKEKKKIKPKKKIAEPEEEDEDNNYDDDIGQVTKTNLPKDVESEENQQEFEYENQEEQEDPEHKDGHVPIMIVPCKEFKFPELDEDDREDNEDESYDDDGNNEDSRQKIKYFKDHLKKCRKCEVTNNDPCEILHIMYDKYDPPSISYMITDSSRLECDLAIEAYENVKKYNPMGTVEKLTIRIMHILDNTSDFDKCMIIVWTDITSEDQNEDSQEENEEEN
jgi:hypothetical protein